MERFYDNEEENDDDRDSFFNSNEPYDGEDLEEEVVGYIDQKGILDVMHMDLTQSQLNQNILSKAIEICKGSWFWSFKKTEDKLEEINMAFKKLMSMTAEYDELDYNPIDTETEEGK
jgi:hypothetical protein